MRDVRSGTTGRRARTRAQHQRNLRLIRQYEANPYPKTKPLGHGLAGKIGMEALDATTGIPSLIHQIRSMRAHRGNLEAEVQPRNVLPLVAALGRGRLKEAWPYKHGGYDAKTGMYRTGPFERRGTMYQKPQLLPGGDYGKNRIGHAAHLLNEAFVGTSDEGGRPIRGPWWVVPSFLGAVAGKPEFLLGHGYETKPGPGPYDHTKRQASNQQRKVAQRHTVFRDTVAEMVASGQKSHAWGVRALKWGDEMARSASPTANLQMGLDYLNSQRRRRKPRPTPGR
jgi:hypothetical protein